MVALAPLLHEAAFLVIKMAYWYHKYSSSKFPMTLSSECDAMIGSLPSPNLNNPRRMAVQDAIVIAFYQVLPPSRPDRGLQGQQI